MNGNPISKVYTLNDILTRVLSRVKVVTPDANLKPKIVAEINAQAILLKEKISAENPDIRSLYLEPAAISFVGGEQTFDTIEVANPLIKEVDDLIAITGSQNYGSVPYVSPEVFRNLSNSVYYDNGLYYTVEGRRIKLYAGQNIDSTVYTFSLRYIREINKLINPSDLMDLPNSKFDDLVNAVVSIFQVKDRE